ncbi:MAG: 2'-5' RNA ligase family protein [Nocardioidaceae bacterium]|nr:2'-5' RNA ligase family protein [Nocardioidaceae bacterium]
MPTIAVAIAVPEPYGTQLRSHRASFGDGQAEIVPTHITLLPPAAVPDRNLPDIEKHLGEVAASHPVFDTHLHGSDTFRPLSPVVFVAVISGFSECEKLATDVRSGPLMCDLPFPFHPHVTVAHDLPDNALDRAAEELSDFDCRFDVRSFALYVHNDRSGWLAKREFILNGGKQSG